MAAMIKAKGPNTECKLLCGGSGATLQVRMMVRMFALAVMVCSIVSIASAEWKEKVLYSFQGGTDGSLPAGGVIFDKAGNLYGLTIYGGSTACPPGWGGTIYE